jgi:CDP-diacylglycerol--serine O-phosphatidyltransferase
MMADPTPSDPQAGSAASGGDARPDGEPEGARSAPPRRIQRRLSAYRAARREQRGERPSPRVAVPSFFTLMNLFSGFLALTQVYEGAFVYACWLIILAGFFDLLDGLMARLADAASPFGVELDSLSDIVSFGVAPAYLVYVYGLSDLGPLGMIVGALPALCGAVRLARYNMSFTGEKGDYFDGLPIPAQAVTIVALILTVDGTDWLSRSSPDALSVFIPIVVVLSGLMVSNIRFDAIPRPTITYLRARPRKMAAYCLAGVAIVGLQEVGLLIVLVTYLLHGIGMACYRLVRALMTPVPEEPPSDTGFASPDARPPDARPPDARPPDGG